jgi:hypothetical protein
MKSIAIFFVIITSVIASCKHLDPNKQIDEGNVKGEIYESKDIGWSIEIPKGWSVISKDYLEKCDQKGKDALQKVYKSDIDFKGLKHLISFKKDKFNCFSSTSEPFKEDHVGEYEENNKLLNELLYKTFCDQEIKTDTSSGKEIIQGLEFNTFHVTFNSPDSKFVLNQIYYSKLINGFDFGVNINYTNEEDRKTMVDAWEKSKFNK